VKIIIFAFISLLLAVPCAARIITVDDDGPADFNNIQAAIDDANDGDIIIVQRGWYDENINFGGKNIVLRSTDPNDPAVVERTVISGGLRTSVVRFSGNETVNCVLSGFTIRDGVWAIAGGGIDGGYGTRATIQHNVITSNVVVPPHPFPMLVDCAGAGIFNCDGTIQYNTISQNLLWGLRVLATYTGGAGLAWCDGTIQYNIITGNRIMSGADAGGGGLAYCNGSIRNNIISYNWGLGEGGGLWGCNGIIKNCIIVGNKADVKPQLSSCSEPSYSCIEGWAGGGVGNIDADPCFADPGNGDFHLKSQGGRWDAGSQTWVLDDVTSPCIDAGDPADPVGQEPFPNGGRVNMGAYGGTAEASKSYFGQPPCETIVAGDINGDCQVDAIDFALLALHWLDER